MLSSESTISKLMWKITEALLNQTFSPENVVCKLRNLIYYLLPYTNPILYPKCIGSRIQTVLKPNKPLSAMTICIHDFYNCVIAYMLQFG